MTYINRFVALSGILLSAFATSCVNEMENELSPVAGEGYYISLTGDMNKDGIDTRAHWDINTVDQSLAFAWDNSYNEMKSFVWRNDGFVDFTNGQKYSATTVTSTETKNQAQLNIITGLSKEYTQGDIIWAVSPLSDTDNYNISDDNKVTFTLPDVFTQTELNSTEHLKPYILMSGTGTVDGENKANIAFEVLPAIYRFKVVNNDDAELTVNEVSISGPFCNKAELSMNGTVTASYGISNESSYTIKVSTPSEGLKIAAKETAYLYALVFPTKTKDITDEISLLFEGKYGDSPVNIIKSAACNTIYAGKDLESNTYYDLSVPVSSSDSNIEIEDYQKMYLADVAKDDANLTQDIFGVPMLIDHTEAYKYRARYYNKEAGTEIYFIPNRDSFSPVCIGVDNSNNSKLSLAADAQPIVLTEANKYYEINLNLIDLTYSMRSYSVNEADDPWASYMKIGTETLDKWANGGTEWTMFKIGWSNTSPSNIQEFIQDETNPHLFYVDKTFPFSDGNNNNIMDFNFFISNYHSDGWWDFISWYKLKSLDREEGVFARFTNADNGTRFINPDYDGPTVYDPDAKEWTWFQVSQPGTYRFYFDVHLGRGKLLKITDSNN